MFVTDYRFRCTPNLSFLKIYTRQIEMILKLLKLDEDMKGYGMKIIIGKKKVTGINAREIMKVKTKKETIPTT